jgi:hypothetical protein
VPTHVALEQVQAHKVLVANEASVDLARLVCIVNALAKATFILLLAQGQVSPGTVLTV